MTLGQDIFIVEPRKTHKEMCFSLFPVWGALRVAAAAAALHCARVVHTVSMQPSRELQLEGATHVITVARSLHHGVYCSMVAPQSKILIPQSKQV